MAKKPEVNIEPITDGSFGDVVDAMVVGKGPINPKHRKAIAGSPDNPLVIGNAEIDCYVLEDETRVLSQRGMFKGLGFARGGPRNEKEASEAGAEVPRFATQKWIEPFISSDLDAALKSPIIFTPPAGNVAYGYPAEFLVDFCDAIIEADQQGATTPRQAKIVQNALLLVRSFAKVGINALVDEATGFQRDRKNDALRLLLVKYIAEGLQTWLHTFPNTFFAELDRLYGNDKTTPRSRPQYYGRFINKYVYDPIEHGYVKSELNKLNITGDGKRKARFHQWLTEDGRNMLIHQIGRVQGLMEMCDGIEQFKGTVTRQKNISIAPYLFEDMNKIIED